MATFSLRPVVPPWIRRLPGWACVALGGASLLLQLPHLSDVPGLHADEAWVGLRAAALLQGAPLSWFGMNDHTGPLHQLLVALAFAALGPSAAALRAVGVVTNAVAVMLYAWVTSQLFGRRTAALAVALLVTAPWYVANARLATEHAALSALLALGSVACLLRGRRPSKLKAAHDPEVTAHPADDQARRRWALAAGVLLGLGTWNHLVFVAVPLTLLSLALLRLGRQIWRRPEVVWACFGWACVELGPLTQLGPRLRLQGGGLGVGARLRDAPALLAQVWQGDVVALRLAGAVARPVGAWSATLLGLACLGLLAAAFDVGGRARRARLVLGAGVLLTGFTAAVVPAHAERHLLLPLLLVPWGVCEGLGNLARATGPRGRTLATAACLLAALGQLSLDYTNLLQPLAHHALVGRTYHFGPQPETSNHARDLRGLYADLLERGVVTVQAHHFIAAPLRFYDLPHGRLHVAELPAAPEALAAAVAKAPADAAAAPLLIYGDEWPALAEPLATATATVTQPASPPAPAPQLAALGPFTLVRLPPRPVANPSTPGRTDDVGG